jgi:hypothetical protein
MMGLVHEWQVDLGKVEDLDIEPAVAPRPLSEPLADRQPDAPRAGTRDDDLQLWHWRSSVQHFVRLDLCFVSICGLHRIVPDYPLQQSPRPGHR